MKDHADFAADFYRIHIRRIDIFIFKKNLSFNFCPVDQIVHPV